MPEVELEIPARPDYLALVRLVVAAALDLDPTLDEGRLDDLRLAVTEATANAIEATEARHRDEPVVVRCLVEADRVEVDIIDRGGGFDPGELTALPAATDPRRLRYESGLGIPLIRSAVDDVRFEQLADGTAVRLTIYRSPKR